MANSMYKKSLNSFFNRKFGAVYDRVHSETMILGCNEHPALIGKKPRAAFCETTPYWFSAKGCALIAAVVFSLPACRFV
jgi:hypothetical protein